MRCAPFCWFQREKKTKYKKLPHTRMCIICAHMQILWLLKYVHIINTQLWSPAVRTIQIHVAVYAYALNIDARRCAGILIVTVGCCLKKLSAAAAGALWHFVNVFFFLSFCCISFSSPFPAVCAEKKNKTQNSFAYHSANKEGKQKPHFSVFGSARGSFLVRATLILEPMNGHRHGRGSLIYITTAEDVNAMI